MPAGEGQGPSDVHLGTTLPPQCWWRVGKRYSFILQRRGGWGLAWGLSKVHSGSKNPPARPSEITVISISITIIITIINLADASWACAPSSTELSNRLGSFSPTLSNTLRSYSLPPAPHPQPLERGPVRLRERSLRDQAESRTAVDKRRKALGPDGAARTRAPRSLAGAAGGLPQSSAARRLRAATPPGRSRRRPAASGGETLGRRAARRAPHARGRLSSESGDWGEWGMGGDTQ